MTCKRIDDYHYWSDQHHALLIFCAEKALSIFSKGNGVDIDELVNVGWMRTLRRRKENELKGCGSFTILHMLDYLSYSARGASNYKFKKYGMPDVIPIGEGFDVPCDDFDPVVILARREGDLTHDRAQPPSFPDDSKLPQFKDIIGLFAD